VTELSLVESAPAPSNRQIAAYFSGKSEKCVTPADIRRWTSKGSQQFRAPDPSGCIHRANVPSDDWQKCAEYFRKGGFPSEAEVLRLAKTAWYFACQRMDFALYETMRDIATEWACENRFQFRNSKARWERLRR
jgi:hypothetical protein